MKRLIGLILIVCGLAIGFFGIPSVMGDKTMNDLKSGVKSGDAGELTEKVAEIAELSVLDFKYSNAISITDKIEIEAFKKKPNSAFSE